MRLQTYEIIPCPQILLQLARNYEELANRCANDKDELFLMATKAINCLEEIISFEGYREDSSGDFYYRLGAQYHFMGDQASFDPSLRAEAYQIASAYYLLAQNNNAKSYDVMDTYYYAMTNHKLGIISAKDNGVYLLCASKSYEEVLNLRSQLKPITISDTYSFCADVNLRLAQHIRHYGASEQLKPSQYYADKSEEYKKKARYAII